MICLFVSFEVKSESDDLSGKQLLCRDSMNVYGFSFSNKDVTFYNLDEVISPGLLSVLRGEYETNLKTIMFSFSEFERFGFEIDRQSLIFTMNGNFKGLKKGSPIKCDIFDGNIGMYIRSLQMKIKKELKSKQKI